ncbi:flagellar biosynthetic protein FliO [Thioalkalivibrio denitrificans]|nr:flagellar biosynthetic protein FliO [Thioalkalivibrio denitrificans]
MAMLSHPIQISFVRRTALALLIGLLPGIALAEGVAAGLPFAGGGASYLAQLLSGLLVVIAAIVVFAFIMRRMTGVQSRLGEEFRVVSGISLGSRERMLLVQVGDRQLVVGVAPGRVQTLHVLDKPLEVPGRTGSPAGGSTGAAESPFARSLRAVLQRRSES